MELGIRSPKWIAGRGVRFELEEGNSSRRVHYLSSWIMEETREETQHGGEKQMVEKKKEGPRR